MAKKAVVLLAEGFEEVEAVTPITFLRRAGIEVVQAAIGESLTVKGARGVTILADTTLAELSGADSFDAIIVPGGLKGAENIAASKAAGALLKNMAKAGKLVCAICAAPAVVLAPLGLLDCVKFTCFPGMEENVKTGKWSQNRVVTDGNIITSRAAGTAFEFAAAIVSKLLGAQAAKETAEQVLLA